MSIQSDAVNNPAAKYAYANDVKYKPLLYCDDTLASSRFDAIFLRPLMRIFRRNL